MTTSLFLHAPKILFDFFIDLLYFIPWWYTRGLVTVSQRTWQSWRTWEAELALGAWVRHVFKPITVRANGRAGLTDVIKRTFGIAWRCTLLAGWSGGAAALVAVYVVAPVAAVWQVVYQLISY